jgi:hypothetical protein
MDTWKVGHRRGGGNGEGGVRNSGGEEGGRWKDDGHNSHNHSRGNKDGISGSGRETDGCSSIEQGCKPPISSPLS